LRFIFDILGCFYTVSIFQDFRHLNKLTGRQTGVSN
jgi:hypothetical protein